LEETQLKSKKHHSLRTLSKGQGQKVALIASILQEPKLWLMDEPFANLDQVTEAWLWEKIKEMLTSGSAVIFTAHQRDFSQQGAKIWQL
jgi:ABC-2 type transport system ATP-binding protein